MQFNFLEDINILDFTSRLPGPFSTMVLASLGAKVTKLENSDVNGDPFNSKEYLQYAPNFQDWYKNINKEKDVIGFSFKDSPELVQQHVNKAQIVLIPEGKYFDSLLSKFELKKKVIIKLSGGKDQWKSLHDLNALALTKTFNDHTRSSETPPYLPIAGLSFAQYLATTALAILRKVERENESITQTIYLKDVTIFILDTLYSQQLGLNGKFLHNGAFPCYQIYKTSDGQSLCLASVEEKYWQNLQIAFGINLKMQDRFDTTEKTSNFLKNMFSKLHSDEIREKIKDTQTCLTIVQNKD
jgi:crotonobetainyl-CoA:carnitine CoA-transferase CaiB-like acyl-CoA transferase